MNSEIIKKRIKECRKAAGLTQVQLANNLNVSTSVINGAENKRGVSKDLAIRLSNYFNKPLDYFLNPDSEREFISTYDEFETVKAVVYRLIQEKLLTSEAIPVQDNEIKNIIEEALWCDIKIILKKKEQGL